MTSTTNTDITMIEAVQNMQSILHSSASPPTTDPSSTVSFGLSTSTTNNNPHYNPHPKFLVWPNTSWIASHLTTLLSAQNHTYATTTLRTEDRESVLTLIDELKPTHVLLCAGVTGRPNVDWCEDHQAETIRSNVIGTLNVVDCCFLRGVHVTVFATGCIYTYDDDHPMSSGKGFSESDPANFSGSFYSKTKSLVETLLAPTYCDANTLVLRLRMPVSEDLHPRSFVTKITKYEHVVDIPNSHSILPDLLPCAILLALRGERGIYNFTNPGAISHNEVLSLYRDIVDPNFTWKNFSLEAQAKVIKADRSNCELDSSKLVAKVTGLGGPEIPEIHRAYRQCFTRMKQNLNKASYD